MNTRDDHPQDVTNTTVQPDGYYSLGTKSYRPPNPPYFTVEQERKMADNDKDIIISGPLYYDSKRQMYYYLRENGNLMANGEIDGNPCDPRINKLRTRYNMFSGNNPETTQQNKKKLELKNFLDNSYEYTRIKEIAQHPNMNDAVNFVYDIEQCNELSDILYDTNNFDFKTTDNIMYYNLGRNITNVCLFAAGVINERVNFEYYVLHLREKVIEHLRKQHGPDFDPSELSHTIPSRRNS
jgi:hypothetical protein